MDRKTTIIIGIILFLTCIHTYVNFATSTYKYFSNIETKTYEISKNDDQSLSQMLTQITELAKKNNVSFYENLFRYNESTETGVSTYYVANYHALTNYFIKGDKLPVDNYENYKMKVPKLYFKYKIKDFSDFARDNPNVEQIVISINAKEKDEQQFLLTLGEKYKIKMQQSAVVERHPKIYLVYLLLIIILILSILFAEKNNQKKYNLQKTLGFSDFDLLWDEAKIVIFQLIKIYALVLIFVLLFVMIKTNLLVYFVLFAIKNLLLEFILLFLIIMVLKFNVIKTDLNYKVIKGLKVTKIEKVTLNLAKVIILVILIASSTLLKEEIKSLKLSINTASENQEKFKGYVSLPITSSDVAYTEELDQQMKQFTSDIYHNTVTKNEGIFINVDAFINNQKTATENERIFFTNSNYLNIQNIKKDGKNLNKNQLSADDIVVLYPNNRTKDEMKKIVKNNTKQHVSYINYDSNQKFETFNNQINTKNNELVDPVMVINNNMSSEQESNAFWSNYILKDKELDKVLNKYDDNNFVKKPEYVNKIFNQNIINLKISMKKSVFTTIVCLIIIVLIILFKTNNYIMENQKEIYVKKVHGYKITENFHSLLMTNLWIYMIVCLVLFVVLNLKSAVIMYILVFIVDCIIMYLSIIYQERKSNADQIRKN